MNKFFKSILRRKKEKEYAVDVKGDCVKVIDIQKNKVIKKYSIQGYVALLIALGLKNEGIKVREIRIDGYHYDDFIKRIK